ncbi:phage/plasmid primase, P4 family [Rhodococcus sp. SORGH_AS_0301]|uniref:DNA primase family protein n=1 Tax=Rhodococcus sp. SORGH_AS_0301 TaxID=3041780 RepID=UPI002784755A|nr:phage/plasmid primase, P4 family [Rhodococcus sp. SORGH_AS_0301]MDQ1182039.1 putative DNA primase/helicase [Rhodococcus sp. SORGH_AS_0301]
MTHAMNVGHASRKRSCTPAMDGPGFHHDFGIDGVDAPAPELVVVPAADDPIQAKLRTRFWPHYNEPRPVARELISRTESSRPLGFWRGQWMAWGGTQWRRLDESACRKLVYDHLENAVIDAGTDKDGVPIPPKPWNPNRTRVSNVLDAMEGLVTIDSELTPPSWRTPSHGSPHVVACTNGLLRVSDRILIEHTPDYFNLVSVPFAFDPAAARPTVWLRSLNEWLPGDAEAIEALQEWFGYIVSGRTDMHKIAMLIGPPRSGKGTIARVLEALVGKENVTGPSTGDLGSRFGLEPLIGKTLGTIADGRVTVRADGIVENLLRISGEDRIQIDIKHQQPWNGKLSARLMFLSNELPRLPDSSNAIKTRMLAFQFRRSFLGAENTNLIDQLTGELPGILLWALDGLDRLYSRGRFLQPDSGAHLLEVLGEGASPVETFIREACETGVERSVAVEIIYKRYSDWCGANGYTPANSSNFGQQLVAAMSTIAPDIKVEKRRVGGRGGRVPTYIGVDVRSRVGAKVV